MESITINLAGQDYEIKELTLGQLEEIQEALVKAPETGRIRSERNREIIAIACSEDHPDITVEKLRKMRLGSIRKVDEVTTAILKFSGYHVSEDKPQGESLAGAA